MGIRWMYDASTPPKNPPKWHVVGGYIGGNTPHVWTKQEWDSQPAPYRNPIFTASNRPDTAEAADIDAEQILRALFDLQVPHGSVVTVDTETVVYTAYLVQLNRMVAPYHLLNYGSYSFVIRNPDTSAGRWAADWTNNIFDGVDLLGQDRIEALQWASDVMRKVPWDSSVTYDTLPYWRR